MIFFVLFALAVSAAVLLFGVLDNSPAEGGLGMFIFFMVPGAIGLLLALGGLACSIWWPPGAIWLSGASITAVAGPWVLLMVESARR